MTALAARAIRKSFGRRQVLADLEIAPAWGRSTSSSTSAASRVWTPDSISPRGEVSVRLLTPGPPLLLLSFGPSRWRPLVGAASQEEVQTAFAGWEMLAAEPADTAGLGWPMNKTAAR